MKKILHCIISMFLILSVLITIQKIPVSAKTPVLGTTVINQNFFETQTCAYNGRIYYALLNGLYSAKKDGTDIKQVCVVDKNGWKHPEITNLTVLGDFIFAIFKPTVDAPDGRLVRINPDGTGYKIYKGNKNDGLDKLCAVNEKLYYSRSYRKNGKYSHHLYSMKPDSPDRKILVKNADFLVTDGKKIYYQPRIDYDGKTPQTVYSCDMKGKHSAKLISEMYFYNFTVNGGYCYYITTENTNTAHIYKKKIKNNSRKNLLRTVHYSQFGPMYMFAEGKNVYYIDADKDKLIQLNTTTRKSKVIKKDVWNFWGVYDNIMVMETKNNSLPA